MDLKLAQRFLPYAGAAIAIITTLSLSSRRSGTGRGNYGRSNDSEGDEAEVSSPPVREDGFQYDVFLSFRGPDTRTFADLLYEALEDKGITFIRSEKLVTGQKVLEQFERIQRSKIFVPIFSRGYADSQWCLKEIAKMVECKRLILPVFVDVEPSEVRSQTGPFGPAFRKHRKNKAIDKVEVSKWSNALKEAGSASGYTLDSTNRYQGKLIQQIVKRILSEENKTSKLLVAEHPVGLEYRILDVMKVLETEAHDDVRMVGICGMGGIGKTTLSKAVYNEIFSRFDACSFISKVIELATQPGLVSLQKQLLCDVFNEKDVTISSTSDGLRQIKERIGAKKVLLVLDDVSDVSQINELVGQLEWFCPGSRIIITTRDKRVLTSARVKQNHVYELKGLDDIQSLELFSWHAFGKKEPDAKFAVLSKEVASTAAGLPLALKIFGSLFFDYKIIEDWQDMLEKLKENLHKDIYQRLRISFDVLDRSEKEVFLDIACFFVGQATKRPTLMWKACRFSPKIAIDQLIHKSLVSINNEGKFEMHDHVRDMGRRIVQAKAEEAGKYSRLWKDDETIDVLQNKRGTEDVEAIRLFCEGEDSVHVDVEYLAAMSQLRMLLLQHVTLKGGYEHFPRKLKWLKWRSQALEKFSIPLHLEMLVVLDLSYSSITQVCHPHKMKAKGFNQLKVLDLSGCWNLSICPDFAGMKHLEMLSFDGCKNMRELHPSIGLLKCLTHLSLSHCSSLNELPQEVWQLTKLQELDLCYCLEITTLPSLKQHPLGELKVLILSRCYNLTMCPDFMGMLHLEKLDFEDCCQMSKLHPSIGHLKSLTYLDLRNCKSLKEVPQEVWQLSSLQVLDLCGCIQITALPSYIRNGESLKQPLLKWLDMSNCSNLITCPEFTSMPHLHRLSFRGCGKITKLGPSIGHLERLMYLGLGGCESLKELPQEIGQLTSLKLIDLRGCISLKELPQEIGQLTSLEQLTLSGCSSLKEVPQEIWQLTSLPRLDFSGCSKITALPSQDQNAETLMLPLLESLDLGACSDLITCPDFTSMPQLLSLSFSGCEKITELDPSIGQLKRLSKMDLRGCKSLKVLPQEIGQLTSLKSLELSSCSSLKELPQEIWQLTSLPEIDFSGCSKITAWPSRIGNAESLTLPLLESLDLRYCSDLVTCPDFTSMPHLQRLSLRGCKKISKLDPSIGQLKRLRDLDLWKCKSLKELPPEIGQLTSLTQLTLEGCSSLKEVPQEIWQLTSLPRLNFSGCSKITELPSHIRNAESLKLPLLEILCLSNCSDLIRCPEFTCMPHLQSLYFIGCEKITKLDPSIGQLKRLTYLNLTGCESLKELPPEIGQLTSLKQLTLMDCSSLKEVPQEIWQLTSLPELSFYGCSKITALPSPIRNAESLQQPYKLESLGLSNCSNLIKCPEFTCMPHLQRLSFRGCEKITKLDPFVGQLKRLTELNLNGCKSLKELPQEIGQLTSLKWLGLSNCSSLEELPQEIGQLTSLKCLWLSNCSSLEEVPQEIWQLTSLLKLDFAGCSKITALPSHIRNAESLKLPLLETLYLSNCGDLIRCPDFTSMPHLQELRFNNCEKITKLDPSIGQLKMLMELDLSLSKSLKELPQEIGQLTSLEKLTMTNCSSLKEVPQEVWQLTSLQKLNLSSCKQITGLPSHIGNAESLCTLDLEGCESLKELPQEIGQVTSLTWLTLKGCSSLKEVPSLPCSLYTLRAAYCHQLESIADVSNLKKLETLDLRGCIRLEDIPGIEQLNCLECLLLGGCRRLADSLFERVQAFQEANVQHLKLFSIPGRLINDGSSDPQSIAFIIPKQFYFGLLCLNVDQSSLDNICSELEKSTPASILSDKSVNDVMQPADCQLGGSVVRVRVDITTDDAQFPFPTCINGWDKNRRHPMATFARDSELMMMATQGRFKGNDVDDAQGRGMMEMCVSIDGCILLHGDFTTIIWTVIDKDFGEDLAEVPDAVVDVFYDEILDPCRVGDSIVRVKFGQLPAFLDMF